MEALENLVPVGHRPYRSLNAFIKLDEVDMALATYEQAEKLGTTGFDYELAANLQGMRGDFEGMIDAYMALLSTKPNYLRTVQNSLPQPQSSADHHRRQPRIGSGVPASRHSEVPDTTVYPELAGVALQSDSGLRPLRGPRQSPRPAAR